MNITKEEITPDMAREYLKKNKGTPEQKELQGQAFELSKAMVETMNASTRIAVVLAGNNVHRNSKKLLTDMKRKLDSAQKDFMQALPEEGKRIMTEQLLDEDHTLQLDACMTMIMNVPKGIRDEIESYIESRYNVYAFKS